MEALHSVGSKHTSDESTSIFAKPEQMTTQHEGREIKKNQHGRSEEHVLFFWPEFYFLFLTECLELESLYSKYFCKQHSFSSIKWTSTIHILFWYVNFVYLSRVECEGGTTVLQSIDNFTTKCAVVLTQYFLCQILCCSKYMLIVDWHYIKSIKMQKPHEYFTVNGISRSSFSKQTSVKYNK